MGIKVMRLKMFLRSFAGKLTIMALIMAMIGVNYMPVFNAQATEYGDGEYILQFGLDELAGATLNSLKINGATWESDLDVFRTTDGIYDIDINYQRAAADASKETGLRTSGDLAPYFANTGGGGTSDGGAILSYRFDYKTALDEQNYFNRLSLQIFVEQNGVPEPGNESDVQINVTGYTGEDAGFIVSDSKTEGKVDITFETLWHMKFVGDITVNGETITVSDYIDYNNQKSYLDHYNEQRVAFTETFDKADDNIYNINVSVERNPHQWIGNFLWTADPAQADGPDYIGHSSLALLAVEYTVGTTTYSCDVDKMTCAWWEAGNEEDAVSCDVTSSACEIPYIEFDSGSQVYDDGSLVVPSGARVTMQIIPDYGYQVLNVNMSELTTNDDGVGEFTFTVPEGAAYFVADVVKTDDTVNTNDTELVSDGSIELGTNQTTLDHGTARLDVADVVLSDENKAKFEDAAEGYEVNNYLDISLYNVTYKGTLDDAWEERVRDLNEEATITLQLEEGVDGNDIVIVHEKHDGTYEIIETTYDPETNTISFKTSSFSNYAIASRTVVTPETGVTTDTEQNSAVVAVPVMYMIAIVAILCYNYRYGFRKK